MKTKMTNPGKPVKKTAEQAQAEAMKRYNEKKAKEKNLSASMAKVQSEAAARVKAKAGGYKTNAKGELILSGGKKATYKGGVTPEKMKNANVQITRTLPEVTVKATRKGAESNLTSYKKVQRAIVNPKDLTPSAKNELMQKKGYKMNAKGQLTSPIMYAKKTKK